MRPCKIWCVYVCHLGSILENDWKGLKLPRLGIFGLPLTWRVKIKPGTPKIMHHTSQITYWILICKFYKILVIKIVVPFNNSLKQIIKKLVKYFFLCENYQIYNTNVYVKSSQTNHFTVKQGTFWKVRVLSKFLKEKHSQVFFFKFD